MRLKLFFLFLTAVVCAACDKEESDAYSEPVPPVPGEGNLQTVFLKFRTDTKRAVENAATDQTADLLSAILYFLDDSPDPVVYAIRTAGAADDMDATIEELARGTVFRGIPEPVTHIYMIGNYNSSDSLDNSASFPTIPGIPLSSIEETLLAIQQVAYGKLSDGTVNSRLLTVLDDMADIIEYAGNEAGWLGDITPGEGDYYANVLLSPVNARIEINRLEYSGTLTSFEIAGIYINNFYSQMPLSLQTDGTGATLINNGSFAYHYDRNDTRFAYTSYSTLYDLVEEEVIPAEGKAVISPASGVWAYHVFGNHAPVPHIIVKFTNVTDANGSNLGDRYITVGGYLRQTEMTEINTLERGNLYQLESLYFTDDDLTVLPEIELLNLWMQLTIISWIPVPINQIL